MTVSRALVISLGVWLLCLVGASLNGFMPGRSIYYAPSWHACYMYPEDPSAADIIGTIFTFLFIILPFGLILLIFMRMFLLARFHAAKIAAQERALGKKSDRKAIMTFVIMTACLSIGLTPFITVSVYTNIKGSVSLWLMCFTELAAFSNSFINVLVYYLRNAAFRETTKTLIVSRIPCMHIKSETPVIPLDAEILS